MASKLAARIAAKPSPIQIKPSKQGSLHTALGISQKQPIPTATLSKKLAGNPSPAMQKKLQFALNARKWNH